MGGAGRETVMTKGSITRRLYGAEKVLERYWYRYEMNPNIVPELEEAGLKSVGRNTHGSGERTEVIDLNGEEPPYFVAAQFKLEFTSHPEKPNLFCLWAYPLRASWLGEREGGLMKK